MIRGESVVVGMRRRDDALQGKPGLTPYFLVGRDHGSWLLARRSGVGYDLPLLSMFSRTCVPGLALESRGRVTLETEGICYREGAGEEVERMRRGRWPGYYCWTVGAGVSGRVD